MLEFNFDEWDHLYKTDPDAFTVKKETVLTELVQRANPRCRKALEHTLFRIRMTQQRAKSPLQSALEASKLMWESFDKLREQLDDLCVITSNTAHNATNHLALHGVSSPHPKEASIHPLLPQNANKGSNIIPFRNLSKS